jgi:hypothetical protein
MAQAIRELEARKAPDAEYRALFSTLSKRPLRRGQTWKARAEALATGDHEAFRRLFNFTQQG